MNFIKKTANEQDSNFIDLILSCIFSAANLDINSYNLGHNFTISTIDVNDGSDFFVDLSYYSDISNYNAFQIYFIQYLSKAIFGDQLDPRPILADLKNRVITGNIPAPTPLPTSTPEPTPEVTTILVPEVTTTLVEQTSTILVPEVTSINHTPEPTPTATQVSSS